MTLTDAIAQALEVPLISNRSPIKPLDAIMGREIVVGQPYTFDFRSVIAQDVEGIYSIRNLVNDRLYIGGAQLVKSRWYHHRSDLTANRHVCLPLQVDFNEHGKEAFVFVLEEQTRLYQRREEDIIRALALTSPERLYNIVLNPLTDDRLSIADLARALAPRMNRSLVQRYDQNAELRKLLQKDDKTYPAHTLHYWQCIAEARAQEPPLVKPETAAIFVRALIDREQAGEDITGNRSSVDALITPDAALVQLSQVAEVVQNILQQQGTQALDLGAEAVALLRQLVSQTAPPEDRLLTLQEAHKEYGVPIHVLRGLRVKVGGRYKVKRSAILHYIAAL